MEKIERFIEVCYGSGDGSGSGDGYGYGSGDGSGSGDGYGSGDGSGDGSGYGYGYGGGSGSGSGYGDGIKSFNNTPVYVIDDIQTAIQHVCGNVAKGFILNDDLTTEPCVIVKSGNLFAHGKTFKEAQRALQLKAIANMDVEEKINMFISEFSADKTYPAKAFYEWHHLLTGSCEQGRISFAKNHGIDIEHDEFTVNDFINLTKDSYGGEIIRRIEERIKGDKP